MTNIQLAVQFFLQLAIILLVCRIVGQIAKYIGQPQVVAEMIAGVLLGPSLFGLLWPELQSALFPWDRTQQARDSQAYLFPASQLGLALYMFVVGMEFRTDLIRKNFKSSVAVSLAGMAAPFVLGAMLAYYFFHHTKLFPERTGVNEAMLFLGASMCITAFPMLARIIHFKGLAGSLMGTVAIGAGAIDDVTAWCLLSVVLASFDNNPSQAINSIGGGVLFVAFAMLVVRPLLNRYQRWFLNEQGQLSEGGVTIGLCLMALGAWFTDLMHLHAVFGAFIVGSTIPKGEISEGLISRIQPLCVALLLPLFFTYSGLNTRIDLLNNLNLWLMCGLVLLVAVLGKGVACTLAARASGLPTRDAMAIGTLMNSRGLMELIIINIGLQRGIITPELFATLVIMAIVTTLMASPLFDLIMKSKPTTELPGTAPTTP